MNPEKPEGGNDPNAPTNPTPDDPATPPNPPDLPNEPTNQPDPPIAPANIPDSTNDPPNEPPNQPEPVNPTPESPAEQSEPPEPPTAPINPPVPPIERTNLPEPPKPPPDPADPPQNPPDPPQEPPASPKRLSYIPEPAIDLRNIITTEDHKKTTLEKTLIFLSAFTLIITFPISVWLCLLILNEYQRAVIFRLGRLRSGGARGPGMLLILPFIDEYVRVDLRLASFDVATQEILTKDSVTIQLDAVVYYRINDPLRAVIQVERVQDATQLLAQTTLRNVIGNCMLIGLLTDKDTISHGMQQILDEGTEPWGVLVERVEIKDVRLPVALQRAMAAEAEAQREAKAKIIAAEGELIASRALKEASDVMSQNTVALQLRFLQTLSTISDRQSRSIIFPLPLDIIRKFIGGEGYVAKKKTPKSPAPLATPPQIPLEPTPLQDNVNRNTQTDPLYVPSDVEL